jgi:two-component system heavy metal sensor histidine kinase CusS
MARPLSITLRLALLFAAVAVIAFASVGAYLNGALTQRMQGRDDADLIAKVKLLRHILDQEESLEAIERDPSRVLNAVYGNDGFLLRLDTMDGRVLVQNAVPSLPFPAASSVPAGKPITGADVLDWTPAMGQGRIVNAIGLVGGAHRSAVHITVARELPEGSLLVKGYAKDLAVAVCIGALLVAGLGLVIVRRGMRPLRAVIGKANNISTHRLNARIAVEDTPSELEELGTAFNAMLDRLEDGVQRLSGFAADLAHDLRTPLNTLMVETQVALAHPRANEEYQSLLASNTEEYERLARMIENTLFLARADNAQLALKREHLSAERELGRIRDYFEGLAEDGGVALVVDAADIMLSADPILLQRAVSNLVSNAIRYTPRRGTVRLLARKGPLGLDIVVENSGAGIAPEHLPRIFERYYRADPARAAQSQSHSAGLGLAIVRAIMQLHGGEVQAESIPGQTTVFYLRFKA